MATPERGETGLRRLWWLLPLALAGFGILQSAAPVAAEDPVIEPSEYAARLSWRPSSVAVAPGGTVGFRNPGKVVPHGVAWTQGPEKPSCSGVPVDSSGTEWSGSCTFAQAGTYAFTCTVHPEEMKGTITVGSGEGAAAPPTSGEQSPAPGGRPFTSLRLARNQSGGTVRGSVAIGAAAAGGMLTVEVWARRASLGAAGSGLARVGRSTRPHLAPGRSSFSVRLGTAARRALGRQGTLTTTVKVLVRTPDGRRAAARRKVELRG